MDIPIPGGDPTGRGTPPYDPLGGRNRLPTGTGPVIVIGICLLVVALIVVALRNL